MELDHRVKRFRLAEAGKGTTTDKLPVLRAAREALQVKLQAWRSEGGRTDLTEEENSSIEELEEDLADVSVPQNGPEMASLGLPSDDQDPRSANPLEMQCELELRIGHAYDLLADVRACVRKKAALIQDKDRNAHGTKDNLRSQKIIKDAHDRTRFLARAYNTNFEKVERLRTRIGGDVSLPTPATNLRAIDLEKDLHMPSLVKARNLGDSKRSLSWIFQVSGLQVSPDHQDAWEKESELRVSLPLHSLIAYLARRVDWFRALAAKERTDEEVNLLYAEGRASRRGFAFAASKYEEHSSALPMYASRGATAYALEKAAMFRRLSTDCETLVAKAHSDYRKRMDEMGEDSDCVRDVYLHAQKGLDLSDSRLDYSLVSANLIQQVLC